MGMGHNDTTRGSQVLVLVSVYQGPTAKCNPIVCFWCNYLGQISYEEFATFLEGGRPSHFLLCLEPMPSAFSRGVPLSVGVLLGCKDKPRGRQLCARLCSDAHSANCSDVDPRTRVVETCQ